MPRMRTAVASLAVALVFGWLAALSCYDIRRTPVTEPADAARGGRDSAGRRRGRARAARAGRGGDVGRGVSAGAPGGAGGDGGRRRQAGDRCGWVGRLLRCRGVVACGVVRAAAHGALRRGYESCCGSSAVPPAPCACRTVRRCAWPPPARRGWLCWGEHMGRWFRCCAGSPPGSRMAARWWPCSKAWSPAWKSPPAKSLISWPAVGSAMAAAPGWRSSVTR